MPPGSNGNRLLLALDFDGTLAPIAARPEDAELLPEAAQYLAELSNSGVISVAVLSGRSIADLRRKVKLDVIYAGNHGLEIEGGGISFIHEEARPRRHIVDLACWDLEAAVEGVRGAFVERKGLTATLHYRQAPDHLAEWIASAVQFVLRPYASSLIVKPARKAWEIRPRVAWDKGSAVRFIAGRLGVSEVICAGDDDTDEAMFAAIPEAVSIHVGQNRSLARYRVSGPEELVDLLRAVTCCPPQPADCW